MTKHFQRNNSKNVAFLVVLAWSFQAFAMSDSELGYFGSSIDYWNENSAKKSPNTLPPKDELKNSKGEAHVDPLTKTKADGGFEWKTYLDPKNKEFFKEGDYTPPEPFMEIVRNPTDENLKLWFAYIDKKNELAHRLQDRMQEYLSKNSVQLGEEGRESVKAKIASLPKTEPDAKRFRFRMYFDSHCPYCRKMFETLSVLQTKGFYVEAKQVDRDSKAAEGLGIPTTRATPDEIKEKGIQSVPVLLIGDLDKKAVYRLGGYQTVASVYAAIAQASHGGTPTN